MPTETTRWAPSAFVATGRSHVAMSNVSRIYSFEVGVPAGVGGLTQASKIMPNQTRAVDTLRFIRKLGHLPQSVMHHVDDALRLHYDV